MNPEVIKLVAGVVVAFSVVSAVTFRGAAAQRRRQNRLQDLAMALDLTFSPVDSLRCDRLPFSAFDHLHERTAENVLVGTAGPCSIRLFDLRWVVDRARGGRTERRRTYMAADLGGVFPHLRLRPQGLLGTVVEHLHGRDIQLEWEEFNDAFVITCDDERFARAVLDAQMMEFLHDVGRGSTIEMRGRWLLLDPERLLPAEEWRRLHTFAVEFRERIPEVVWSLYPGPGADPERDPPLALPPIELLVPHHEYTGEFDWVTGRDDVPELPRLGRGDGDGAR